MDGVGRLSVVWSPAATTPMLGVGRSSVFWSPVATTRMLPEAPTGDLLSGSEMKERETRRERVGDEADSLAREEQQDGRAELVELQEQLVHKEREGAKHGTREELLQPEMTTVEGVGRSSVFWSPAAMTRMIPEVPTGDFLFGSEMKERERGERARETEREEGERERAMRERETRRERVVDAADSLAHEGRRDELVERVAMQEESLQPEMTPMDGVGRLSVVWSPAATTPMLGVGRSSVFWSPVAPTDDLLSGSEMKERETRRERVGDEADSLAREEQHDGRAELVELQEQLVHKEREGRGRGRHSGG